MNKNRVTLICEHCGKEYEVKRTRLTTSKYCSVNCRNESRKSNITLECKGCGKLYTVPLYKKDTSKYCSIECKNKYGNIIIEKEYNCRLCGDPFLSKHKREFCSIRCENAVKGFLEDKELQHEYPNRGEGETKRKCLICGKTYVGRMDCCDVVCLEHSYKKDKELYKRLYKESRRWRAIDIEKGID